MTATEDIRALLLSIDVQLVFEIEPATHANEPNELRQQLAKARAQRDAVVHAVGAGSVDPDVVAEAARSMRAAKEKAEADRDEACKQLTIVKIERYEALAARDEWIEHRHEQRIKLKAMCLERDAARIERNESRAKLDAVRALARLALADAVAYVAECDLAAKAHFAAGSRFRNREGSDEVTHAQLCARSARRAIRHLADKLDAMDGDP